VKPTVGDDFKFLKLLNVIIGVLILQYKLSHITTLLFLLGNAESVLFL